MTKGLVDDLYGDRVEGIGLSVSPLLKGQSGDFDHSERIWSHLEALEHALAESVLV